MGYESAARQLHAGEDPSFEVEDGLGQRIELWTKLPVTEERLK